MSFFAEMLTEAIGWPVCIGLFAWCLLSGPKPIRRRRTATAPAPRDTSRTYPRPGRTRSKLTRVCPVCGMEDPGNLDGKVLGWPAHGSCAEWLGDWRPAKAAVVSGGEYATEPVWCQGGMTNTIVFTGTGTLSSAGGGGGSSMNSAAFASPETMAVQRLVANGFITLDEARERLDPEISAVFGVPPLDLD